MPAAPLFWLPTLETPNEDARSELIASLLPLEDASTLHATLRDLRHRLMTSLPASDDELLALVDAACTALSDVDQEVALAAASAPWDRRVDSRRDMIADKRLALGDLAGDETLTATMVVPLLRRASRLRDPERLELTMTAVGVLTASLAGHGEHTLRIGLGAMRPPLLLRYQPMGRCTGLRLWPSARLAIGALCSGWAGLRVGPGTSVLELGCGTAAVGLACAALGARSCWLTDIDDDALALAARNARLNGLDGSTAVAKLDLLDDGCGEDAAARPAGMPCNGFDLVVAADVVYAWAEEAQGETMWAAMARHLDATNPDARVLCCFGEGKRSEAAWRTVQQLEAASQQQGGAAGLRCVAREEVRADGERDGLLMLLLAPV
tara:strand:+ start:594 stop:1733 length:1140 start_codon:yes stop_codon:yes gene_type:complete